MDTTSSRRTVLASIAGAAVAAPAIAKARTTSDSHAPLVFILERYQSTMSFYCEASNRHDETKFASHRMRARVLPTAITCPR
jgi:hypothetical protein